MKYNVDEMWVVLSQSYIYMTKWKKNVKLKQHYFPHRATARPFSHLRVHCSRAGVLLWRSIHSNQCNNPQWTQQRTRAPPTGVQTTAPQCDSIRPQSVSADQSVLVLDRKGQEFSDMCEMWRNCCYNVRGLRCCWRLKAREMFTLGLDVMSKNIQLHPARGDCGIAWREHLELSDRRTRAQLEHICVWGAFPSLMWEQTHWPWSSLKQILLLLWFIHQWWCSKRNECFSS